MIEPNFKTRLVIMGCLVSKSRLIRWIVVASSVISWAAAGGLLPWGAAAYAADEPAARVSAADTFELPLNGEWEVGTNRAYDRTAVVPGVVTDPGKVNDGALWYRREVRLPGGDWSHVTLVLNGARFDPVIYVNGQKVSEKPGGMTVTTHLLDHPDVAPGKKIVLEIALKSLKDVDRGNASRIPDADLWRSNISSSLWDKVTLRTHGPARITRLIPFTEFERDSLTVHWTLQRLGGTPPPPFNLTVEAEVVGKDGQAIARGTTKNAGLEGTTLVNLKGACRPWSPDDPATYILRVTLKNDGKTVDRLAMTWGLRNFRTRGRGFQLNGNPVRLRAGTVVWHRWVRDPESHELAFDTKWFEKNIILRLKSHGVNTLRFHLGNPPEALLDLCDRYGLLVQYEWSFFHGMKASRESLLDQWRNWLDMAMRHPSVVIIHPWNETEEGDELKTATAVLDEITPEYPPLVTAHRDVTHIHKYWWSLFENLGLYYDSAAEFPQPVMADEFGGNYLDGEGNPGGYPTIKESLMRFLGRDHTRESRLRLHTESNARVAEYWRRIGVAGFSPFCILGSPEDGNHWFLGKLKDANPKPVWAALTAAWSPQSVSLEVWDQNYTPGQIVTLPVYFFNDTALPARLDADVLVLKEDAGAGGGKETTTAKRLSVRVPAFGRVKRLVTLELPKNEGDWLFQATLRNAPKSVTHPVVSEWRFRTINPKTPDALRSIKIAVPDGEPELRDFLVGQNLAVVGLSDPKAKIVATSRATWGTIQSDSRIREELAGAIRRGSSVVMLDVGPKFLGPEYPTRGGGVPDLPGGGIPKGQTSESFQVDLFANIKAVFRRAAEPESNIHPSPPRASSLWENLRPEDTQIWNGLRGGLIVPAAEMELGGLSPAAFVSLWESKGADPALIKGGSYFAYELQNFYAYSTRKDDAEVASRLRARIRFLVEDAPALAITLNTNAPIVVTDLAKKYKEASSGEAEAFNALAVAGKNLTRSPVVEIVFGSGRGKLILSQLITAGRLDKRDRRTPSAARLYRIRYDPAAAQFVLNMLRQSLSG